MTTLILRIWAVGKLPLTREISSTIYYVKEGLRRMIGFGLSIKFSEYL